MAIRHNPMKRKEIQETVLRFAFNYNTVESFLLMSAVLICTFGVMFSSEFFEPGTYSYITLGGVTMAVIVISCTCEFRQPPLPSFVHRYLTLPDHGALISRSFAVCLPSPVARQTSSWSFGLNSSPYSFLP